MFLFDEPEIIDICPGGVTRRLGHLGPPGRSPGLPDRHSCRRYFRGHAGACFWTSDVAHAATGGRTRRLLGLKPLDIHRFPLNFIEFH